jgi:hypothetical protein
VKRVRVIAKAKDDDYPWAFTAVYEEHDEHGTWRAIGFGDGDDRADALAALRTDYPLAQGVEVVG